MKRAFLFLTAAICSFSTLSAQDETPDTVKVGLYFNSVYDLDLANKSFTADFWIWYNYSNDSINPLESVEISNAKEFEFVMTDVEKVGNINWATHKCRAVLKKEWDLRNFPFDKQVLEVHLEDAIEDVSSLIYVADSVNSKYDNEIKLDGWVIKRFHVYPSNRTYNTTYGNPELDGQSTYPSVVAKFELERDGIGLFFKLFMGVYVAYLISLSVFFMGPENPERFGMIVGALFAGVANKYIVDSIMPQTIMLTLPDKIHNVTFFYIILHLAITVWAFRLSVKEKMKQGWLLDYTSFIVSIISFIAINWILIWQAL
jgi:hypothetical protein